MVYKLSCNGCTSAYGGQTVRHLTIRIEEHENADSPVGLDLQQGSLDGNTADLCWEIIDRSNNQRKFTGGNTNQEREIGLKLAP